MNYLLLICLVSVAAALPAGDAQTNLQQQPAPEQKVTEAKPVPDPVVKEVKPSNSTEKQESNKPKVEIKISQKTKVSNDPATVQKPEEKTEVKIEVKKVLIKSAKNDTVNQPKEEKNQTNTVSIDVNKNNATKPEEVQNDAKVSNTTQTTDKPKDDKKGPALFEDMKSGNYSSVFDWLNSKISIVWSGQSGPEKEPVYIVVVEPDHKLKSSSFTTCVQPLLSIGLSLLVLLHTVL